MPQPAALNFLGSPGPAFSLSPSIPASAPALTPIPHSVRPYPAPISAPGCLQSQPSPSTHCSPSLCPTPGLRLCLAFCGPSGHGPRPFGQQLCPLCQAIGRAWGPRLTAAFVPRSSQAMDETPGPLPPALKALLSSQGFPRGSLPISFPTTSLPPPSPSSAQYPALELRPATEPHL